MDNTYAQLAALWEPLHGAQFEAALTRSRWYVKTHGEFGWCVMPADVPADSGVPLVAASESYATALSVASNHNLDLDRELGRLAGVLVDAMSADDRRAFLIWMTDHAPQVLLQALDLWKRPYPTAAELDDAYAQALAEQPGQRTEQ